MDSYYQGRTNFSDVISQGRSPPIPYNMIVSKHLHLYVLAVHSYVTSIDILLLKAILITLNISSERYRKSLKMWISFVKQIWKKTLVKKRAPVHRLVRLDFNPIQDGHFPGCSRMGGGAKRPPSLKITNPPMMKLGTAILYLKKIQKIFESRDTSPDFC